MMVPVILVPIVHALSTKHIVEIPVAVPRRVRMFLFGYFRCFYLQTQVNEDGKVALVPKPKKYVGRRNVLVSEQMSNVTPKYAYRVVQSRYSLSFRISPTFVHSTSLISGVKKLDTCR